MPDGYLRVEDGGDLFIIADDASFVGKVFPQALSITRVGVGYGPLVLS